MLTTRGSSKSSFAWFWSRILYRIFRFALRHLSKSSAACANRFMHEFNIGHLSVGVVTHDRLRPEGYSKEELVSMLALVREHEAKMGWRVPESPEKSSSPPPQLSVGEAAHLLRALTRAQNQLDTLASERFAATFHPLHEVLDSLLLGIGLRVANLAGGLTNQALVGAWKIEKPNEVVLISMQRRGDDEQALGRLVRDDTVCLRCEKVKLSSSHDCSSDKITGTTLPEDTTNYQSLDRRARFLETHPLEDVTVDQLREALVKRRALIQQNRCPQCQQQMLGQPRACPVHGMPS